MKIVRSLLSVLVLFTLASPLALAAETYEIDPVHSAIVFRVNHLGVAYTWGRFNDFSGTFVVDEEKPENSTVELEIKTESVDTNSEKRDKHLRNPDFFDAKTFPVARFESNAVERDGDTYTVQGTLELHGKKRPVTLVMERVGSAEDPWGGYRTGFTGEHTLKRSEYDINYGLNGPVGDEVQLFFDFEAIRQ
jgi:polyisoprenoid-binding protein YceI